MQARPLLSDGKTEALVDPRLGGDYDVEQARRVAFVASLCVRAPATWRPSMTEVRVMFRQGQVAITHKSISSGRSPYRRPCLLAKHWNWNSSITLLANLLQWFFFFGYRFRAGEFSRSLELAFVAGHRKAHVSMRAATG